MDDHWNKLSAGSAPSAPQCGSLKDGYGLFWQVVPVIRKEMTADSDPKRGGRVMTALLQMKKLDIKGLKEAYAGRGKV